MGIERRISYEAHLNLKLIPVWGNAYKIRISLFLYLPVYVALYFFLYFFFKKKNILYLFNKCITIEENDRLV